MPKATIPFDIQYLVLRELSDIGTLQMQKEQFDTIVSCLCVCQQWNQALEELLLQRNRVITIVWSSFRVRKLTVQKIAAEYNLRDAEHVLHGGETAGPPSRAVVEVGEGKGVDPLSEDLERCLRACCFYGDITLAQICLGTGISYRPEALVVNAIDGNRIEFLDFLFDSGNANIGDERIYLSALDHAFWQQRTSIADYVLTCSPCLNIRQRCRLWNAYEERVLVLYAAFNGRAEMLKMLLSHGIDTDLVMDDKQPLMCAVHSGSLETIEVLIQHGVDLKPPARLWDWPLYHAVGWGNLEMMKLLLDNGSLPEPGTRMHEVLLASARERDSSDVIDMLQSYASSA
ncbi:ankyrin repeat-containing domain protein [Aspergillus crustosus]